MAFIDDIKKLSAKIKNTKNKIKSEEATKHSLILPFISLLDYDSSDPSEVEPEYEPQKKPGTKKNDRIDYVILNNDKPSIIIEVKHIDDSLTSHYNQLFSYFSWTSPDFAILTNGIDYKFYSDIDEKNKMDEEPFLEFSLENINESTITHLKRFNKNDYDSKKLRELARSLKEELRELAASLKYTSTIKLLIDKELKEPSHEFIKYFIKDFHNGSINSGVTEKYKKPFINSLHLSISEMFPDLITNQKNDNETYVKKKTIKVKNARKNLPVIRKKVSTTRGRPRNVVSQNIVKASAVSEQKLISLIKSICKEKINSKRISEKLVGSTLAFSIDKNPKKVYCQVNIDKKYLLLDGDMFEFEKINDINKYKSKFHKVISNLEKNT